MAYRTHPTGGGETVVFTHEVTGAAVQNIDITGLNGDADERYLVKAWGPTAGATSFCEIHPQLASTGMQRQAFSQSDGGATVDSNGANGPLTTRAGTSDLEVVVTAKTGQPRMFRCISNIGNSGGNRNQYHGQGLWTDTTTNLTSIRLAGGAAGCFAVGFKVRVTKY